ncbi:class I SAM-dependent methyltransferase [Kribbella sp. NPDC048915]|uniref:class I SAM-dependent methyltransferase n=1 Tax=Kribbella sp. NPDC048915 TaxID=3155148 RepID=UPI0033F81855
MKQPWNHNIHYHPQVLRAVPAGAERALDIEYVLGDFLEYPLEPESYDVIGSIATLHHVDAREGLLRMRELLRPGGVLVVIGLAREWLPRDLPQVVAGAAVHRVHRLTKGCWEHPSPTVWPPPVTYEEMRDHTMTLLPGATFRRHLLFRYSITWRK